MKKKRAVLHKQKKKKFGCIKTKKNIKQSKIRQKIISKI